MLSFIFILLCRIYVVLGQLGLLYADMVSTAVQFNQYHLRGEGGVCELGD